MSLSARGLKKCDFLIFSLLSCLNRRMTGLLAALLSLKGLKEESDTRQHAHEKNRMTMSMAQARFS
jgi:hypothetical protein